MKLLKPFWCVAVCLLAFTLSSEAKAQLVPGRDFRVISPHQATTGGKQVEVIEFFWYGCPHCNNLQNPLRIWLRRKPADVEFRRMPAVINDSWLPLTRAFYALEAIGALDKLHYEVFAAIHEQQLRLSNEKVLFEWVGKQGVDPKQFADIYNSFGVRSRTNRAADITRSYDIPGTPALAVDGKYLVAPSMTLNPDNSVNYERFFKVLDQVIAMARKERAAR